MTSPQICLGTAQFGLHYGITNAAGQVSELEVKHLLNRAHAAGICWLDTAQAYGNAEAVLGKTMPPGKSFRLISKLTSQPQPEFRAEDSESWEQAFSDSCQHLGVQHLDTLLLHSSADLTKPGGKYLEAWLLGLRQRGLVQRLGVSIYQADELKAVSPALLDVVQLPISLYDQRLLRDGTVARLRSNGIAIHARSIYLQGLLLKPAEQWPSWVHPEVQAHQRSLETLALSRHCQLIDLALGFAKAQANLEAVVVGVCSVNELTELIDCWSAPSPWGRDEWRSWFLDNQTILDPRCWLVNQ